MQNINPIAKASMLIRKPVAEVFDAFIDPAITAKFWFTKGSGKLKEGANLRWTWEMYQLNIPVQVVQVIPNKKITILWGTDAQESKVEWTFQTHDQGTYVRIENSGFSGSTEEKVAQAIDSTGGFTIVLDGLKAYLEHGIELGLIGDKHPAGV